jgi:peptidoglycan hydrolase-like protein with peptidoglycan-binding domain
MTTLQQVINQRLEIPYGNLGTSPLTTDQQLCREIQECLHVNRYYEYNIDGIFGGITQRALREFKQAKGITGGDILGKTTAEYLLEEKKEHGLLPPPFGAGRDNLTRAVIREGRKHGLTLQTQIAYVMATVQHEVAGTYKPIKEFGGASRPYAPYFGRGYVQLTHKTNYQKYTDILDIDLVSNPDKVLDPQIALFIDARRVVNDEDKKELIAGYAHQWVTRLNSFFFAPESLAEDPLVPELGTIESPFIDENTPMLPEERLIIDAIMSS